MTTTSHHEGAEVSYRWFAETEASGQGGGSLEGAGSAAFAATFALTALALHGVDAAEVARKVARALNST